jgi:hypothetical protein
MSVEQSVKWELAVETKVLGENLPFCPPQILHDLTWNRTQAAAVRSRRLTAWAIAQGGGISAELQAILSRDFVFIFPVSEGLCCVIP